VIEPSALFRALQRHGVGFFAGVPDSLLASFCAYVDDECGPNEHVIAANEGNAIALGAGFHLSSGKVAAVYMQNSGLGNAINPLTSLADLEVYAIPLVLIIGWRGEPGVKDEPQHIKQGRITPEQLELLEIPFWVVDRNSDAEDVVQRAFSALSARNAPVAFLVRKDSFAKYKSRRQRASALNLKREDALRELLALVRPDDLIVSTTGKTSREVFELRAASGKPQRDFLTVGGMGHTASLAAGVALGNPGKRVVCLDGDGSVLMHLGALPVIGQLRPPNFLHVLLNNAAHESVGGQPTVGDRIDFAAIARSSGYLDYRCAADAESLRTAWTEVSSREGPVMLEVRIEIGSRADLGRPTSTPEQNKRAFLDVARS
jgi:phosphonopyruvate decarboxylase